MNLRGVMLLVLMSATHGVVLAQSRSVSASRFDDVSTTELMEEVRHLEGLFSSEEVSVFRVIHTSDELPSRALAMLKSVVSRGSLAEWGEGWNSTDILSKDEPMARHVVSWVSSSITVTVFQTGGFGVTTNLLLTDVAERIYCVYGLGRKDPSVSLEGAQWLLRPNRRYGVPKPECHPYDAASLHRIR
jgi:hypothetical protein